MQFRYIIASVIGALAIAGAAGAQNAAADPAGVAQPQPAKEKKLCRSEEETGSIMRKRTCRSAADWAAIDAANRQNVERSGVGRNPVGGGGPH